MRKDVIVSSVFGIIMKLNDFRSVAKNIISFGYVFISEDRMGKMGAKMNIKDCIAPPFSASETIPQSEQYSACNLN